MEFAILHMMTRRRRRRRRRRRQQQQQQQWRWHTEIDMRELKSVSIESVFEFD